MTTWPKHFAVIKAAKSIKKEIELAGLENLKYLAQNNISIVRTYLNGCSRQKKAEYKRDLGALLALGITPEMILEELGRQIPDLASFMVGRDSYKKSELKALDGFIKEA